MVLLPPGFKSKNTFYTAGFGRDFEFPFACKKKKEKKEQNECLTQKICNNTWWLNHPFKLNAIPAFESIGNTCKFLIFLLIFWPEKKIKSFCHGTSDISAQCFASAPFLCEKFAYFRAKNYTSSVLDMSREQKGVLNLSSTVDDLIHFSPTILDHVEKNRDCLSLLSASL